MKLPNQRVLFRVVAGKEMPKPGDYVTLRRRSDNFTIKGRFLRHEYLDTATVLPDQRIDVSEDWVIE